MDDTSYMDTSSDDDVDCNLPLSVRIQMKQNAAKGTDKIVWSPKSFRLKNSASSKTPGCGSAAAGRFHERGSPLSEVSSNVTSGSSPSLWKRSDKSKWSSRPAESRKSDSRSPYEGAVRTSDSEVYKQNTEDRSHGERSSFSDCDKKQGSYKKGGYHSADKAWTEAGTSSSTSIHRDVQNGIKVGPTSPNCYVKPFNMSYDPQKKASDTARSSTTSFSSKDRKSSTQGENGKRLVTAFETPGSKSFSLRFSFPPKKSPENISSSVTSSLSEKSLKSSAVESKTLPGSPSENFSPSSVHISWDRAGKMQYTPLDSPRFGSSRSDASPSRTPKRSSYSGISSKIETPSPIVVPDTPGSVRSLDSHDRMPHRHSSDYYRKDGQTSWGKSEFPRRRSRDVLLNNLLEDISSASPKSPTFGSSEKNYHRHNANLRTSSSTKFSSMPLSSPNTSASPRKYSLSPSSRRHSGSLDKHSHRSYEPHQHRDPVWDFAVERSEPSRNIANGSLGQSHQRDGRTRDPERIEDPLARLGGSRDAYPHSRSTSEDDNVPLNKLKHKYHTTGHRKQTSPILSKSSQGNASSSVVSPSKLWTSPLKRSSVSPMFSKNKTSPTGKGVISPVKFYATANRSRSWEFGKRREEEKEASSGRDVGKKEGSRHNLHHAKKMGQLFGFSSSDEEDDGDHHDNRKRKGDNPSTSHFDDSDATSKRRKTSPPDFDARGEGSSSHQSRKSIDNSKKSTSSLTGSRSSEEQTPNSNFTYERSNSPAYDHESPDIPGPSTRHHRHSKSKEKSSRESSSSKDRAHGKSKGRKQSPHASAIVTASLHTTFSSSHDSGSGDKHSRKKSKGKGKKASPPSTLTSSPSGATSSISTYSMRGDGANASVDSSRRDSPDVPSSTFAGSRHITVNDASDDDVVVVDSYSYAASLIDSYSKKRKSHKKKKTGTHSPTSTSEGATGGSEMEKDAVSPTMLERFNQLDEDEAFARRLQASAAFLFFSLINFVVMIVYHE